MTKSSNLPASRPDWWHVDSKGRRIGWMWPEDFKIALDSIWGTRKGIAAFAEYVDMSRTAIEGYANGKVPVPKHIALLVMSLVQLLPRWQAKQTATRRVRDFPKPRAEWLPDTKNKSEIGVARRPFG